MKIGIFTNNYLPNPYGVAGSVESFRKEFERLGHDVFVFAPGWKGYSDENKRVLRFPSFEIKLKIRFPLAIPYSGKTDKVLKKMELDIIHSQHPNLMGMAAMRWARKKNIPLVFTWHTLFDKYTHFVPFIPRKIADWWVIGNARNYANKCDAVVVPTPGVAAIIKKWGVENKNIYSVPTGVEKKLFENPDRAGIREKYEIAHDETLLCVLTRFTTEKNIEFLFDCALEVLRRNKKVKFMASGKGDLEEKLREKVAAALLESRVIFVGHVADDQRKNYYAAGDIFVYASKSETQGMVLTEAMYCGLPIVAVRATGAQDIVEEGKTGYLVEENTEAFSTAVQKLIDDGNLRKNFGERAMKVAREKYTSEVCAKKMFEVYEKAIEAKKVR